MHEYELPIPADHVRALYLAAHGGKSPANESELWPSFVDVARGVIAKSQREALNKVSEIVGVPPIPLDYMEGGFRTGFESRSKQYGAAITEYSILTYALESKMLNALSAMGLR